MRPQPQRLLLALRAHVLNAHASRLSPNISMQHVKRLYFVCAYTRARRSLCYLPRSASTLRCRPFALLFFLFLGSIPFLNKKRKNSLAYLGAMVLR